MTPAVVMIVDDNKADLLLAKRVLDKEKLFNTVCCFSEPHKALSFLESNPVDVLMVDMKFSNGSGLDFLRAAKACGLLDSKILIVISDVKDPDVVAEADLLGISVWIDKPLNLQKLHYVVMHVPNLFMGVLLRSKKQLAANF